MNLQAKNAFKTAYLNAIPSEPFPLIDLSQVGRKFLPIPQDFYRPTDTRG